jgi:hypothetical protein
MKKIWVCVYCGTEVNDGCPDPSMFSCCGEVGHVEEVDEDEELETPENAYEDDLCGDLSGGPEY